tara:strand:+ start:525 stop:1340 length:816 start_codon:yes stop_codon:yes gene_type:complete
MHVIGFGGAGCKVARKFLEYPQYEVHFVDKGQEYNLPAASTIEDAEKTAPVFKKLIKKIDDDVLFICSGGGITSGAMLAILQSISHMRVTIIYIKPDTAFLNSGAQRRERLVYNVLQQYAHSGLFERIYILSNPDMAGVLGDLSISEYYNKINSLIAGTIHMINYLNNTDSIMSNISPPTETNRISTIGFYDSDSGEEKYFFDLKNIREKNFYYTFSETMLAEEKNLLNKIAEQIKNAGQDDLTTVSYSITSTEYENSYVYLVAHTNFVQE